MFLNNTDLSEFITGQAQPKLSQEKLNRIKIPVLPLTEQKQIVTKIEEFEKQISVLEDSIKSIEQEKEAVLKKYL